MNNRLKVLLAEVFRLRESEINIKLEKKDVGSWDSLKQMDLVMSIEKEYSISLGIHDIVRMVSVASIIDVLKEKGIELAD